MSWAKLSDDYSDDCWTLSDEAFRLHTEALVWNGRKLLDCRISKDNVRRFAKHPEAVQELLDCGWWTDDGDVYIIRHHAQYQRTREAVVNQQAANAKNGAKGGRPKKPREQASEIKPPKTQSVSESLTESRSETLPNPQPARRPSSTSQAGETQSVSESPSGSETERDRTGQEAVTGPRAKEGFAKPKPCRHGVANGREPDPWLNGRATCTQCAAEMKEAS
jgi:hypothetical protein